MTSASDRSSNRRLILHMSVSLDGFVARRPGGIDSYADGSVAYQLTGGG